MTDKCINHRRPPRTAAGAKFWFCLMLLLVLLKSLLVEGLQQYVFNWKRSSILFIIYLQSKYLNLRQKEPPFPVIHILL